VRGPHTTESSDSEYNADSEFHNQDQPQHGTTRRHSQSTYHYSPGVMDPMWEAGKDKVHLNLNMTPNTATHF